MTPERAREIYTKQLEFPYWGNFRKFMTPEEMDHVIGILRESGDGRLTIAQIVINIMHGKKEGQ